jgi:hypothetical protein
MMIRVAATVVGQLYRSVCSECLAQEIGSTEQDADDVARCLAGARFVREWQRCGRCGEADMVLTHIPSWPLFAYAQD